MTYQQTIDYMFAQLPMYHRIGAAAYKADIQPTIDMMAALGNPERKFRSIHVAGTNGKGSVSHFLASILQEAGYKVGLYTSPHLVDFRERIRINGEMIPQAAVVDFVESHRAMLAERGLSFFEMTVGLAFDYFATQQVDIAVVEVGMGGRLDSTNVITPLLSVITNIGLDHTQFLGHTLAEIAREKAGIIKPDVPVVIGETQEETAPVFMSVAESLGAPISFADHHWRIREGDDNPSEEQLIFDVLDMDACVGATPEFDGWTLGLTSQLAGSYQLHNLATVMEAVRRLPMPITEAHLRRGIAHVVDNTHLQGRWQVIGHSPLTICETAHNAPGVESMLGKIASMTFSRLHVVYGCVNDKDYAAILRMLQRRLPADTCWYFSQPTVERRKPVAELLAGAEALGLSGRPFERVADAIEAARAAASPLDMVLVTGSIFLVADALAGIKQD